MILKSFATFIPSVLAGFGLVHLFWRQDHSVALALKVFLGAGLGIGITSCLYFLKLLTIGGQGGYLLTQIAFLLLVVIALFLQKRLSISVSPQSISFSWVQALLILAAISVAGIALYYLVSFARFAPHGDYDAQAIWNLRARSIYRSGDAWENAFSALINRNFHMDYPLLIPLSVVGGWNTLGGEVLRVPAVLSMLFLFGLAGVIYFTTTYLRSSSQAALATMVLLATPGLLLYSTFQTADIPLTYFFIGSTGLLVLAGNEDNWGLVFLSGLMAGLSAWAKNEGLPFVLLITLCVLFVFGFRRRYATILSLLAGMVFPLFTLVLFKTQVSANNDLFTGNPLSEIFAKLVDPGRYVQIFTRLFAEVGRLGDWPISILVVLLVYGWIMGLRKSNSPAEKFSLLLPLSQLVVYLFIYLITPHDLQWHLNYSMSRLLIHVFPLALFSFFLYVNTPETVLRKQY